jgi:hypothetical protein
MLTDAAEVILELFLFDNPDDQAIIQHSNLLRACREIGIEAAYNAIRTLPSSPT